MTYRESARIARELAASRYVYNREGPVIDEELTREELEKLYDPEYMRKRRGEAHLWGKDLAAPKGGQ